MRITNILSTLALGVLVAAPAGSQSTRDAELAAANADLNATYRGLMRRLTPVDQTGLRNAQRVWITFRDADCRVGWTDKRDCLVARTNERELQLRQSTFFDARGESIHLPAPG